MTAAAPDLSPQQSKILGFLREHAKAHTYSPTISEIGTAAGIATSTANYHLNALQRKGWIVRHGTRAITVANADETITAGCCPHCGKERTPPPCN